MKPSLAGFFFFSFLSFASCAGCCCSPLAVAEGAAAGLLLGSAVDCVGALGTLLVKSYCCVTKIDSIDFIHESNQQSNLLVDFLN